MSGINLMRQHPCCIDCGSPYAPVNAHSEQPWWKFWTIDRGKWRARHFPSECVAELGFCGWTIARCCPTCGNKDIAKASEEDVFAASALSSGNYTEEEQ